MIESCRHRRSIGASDPGRFPASPEALSSKAAGPDQDAVNRSGYIETEVRQKYWWDFGQIFASIIPAAVLGKLIAMLWRTVFNT